MNGKQSKLVLALSPIPVVGERNAYELVLENVKKKYPSVYSRKPNHEPPWIIPLNHRIMEMTLFLRMGVYLSYFGIGCGLYELAGLVSKAILK